jgi:hypothetical protein
LITRRAPPIRHTTEESPKESAPRILNIGWRANAEDAAECPPSRSTSLALDRILSIHSLSNSIGDGRRSMQPRARNNAWHSAANSAPDRSAFGEAIFGLAGLNFGEGPLAQKNVALLTFVWVGCER